MRIYPVITGLRRILQGLLCGLESGFKFTAFFIFNDGWFYFREKSHSIEKCFSIGFVISLLAHSMLGSVDDTSFGIAS